MSAIKLYKQNNKILTEMPKLYANVMKFLTLRDLKFGLIRDSYHANRKQNVWECECD